MRRITQAFILTPVLFVLAVLGTAASMESSSDALPALEPAAVEFELVTSIPAGGASSPQFHQISGVQLGPTKDQIYVLDRFRNSVRAFDFDGNLIREFAGEGEGPGQIARPIGLRIIGDRVHVRDGDTSRLTWFDWTGDYAGSRTSAAHYPARDAETVRRSDAEAVMRHGQLLAHYGGDPGRAILLLLDEGDVLVDTIFNVRGGFTYIRARSRPEARTRVPRIPSFGMEAHWMPIGDSLVVSVDQRHGIVQWHRVDRGRVVPVQRREIGLIPRPVSLSEGEVRAHAAEALDLPPSEIMEVDIPEFEAQLLWGFGDPRTGDVWVRRVYDDDFQSDSFVERRILVPWDKSAPVLEIELPRNFLLRAAVDDLLLGIYVEPETEVQSVRVYRWGAP